MMIISITAYLLWNKFNWFIFRNSLFGKLNRYFMVEIFGETKVFLNLSFKSISASFLVGQKLKTGIIY